MSDTIGNVPGLVNRNIILGKEVGTYNTKEEASKAAK